MSKYRLLRERIAGCHFASQCELLIPPAATDSQLTLVHTEDYVDAVKTGVLTDLQIRRIGFPWSKKMVERSRRSTGASIAAARRAIVDGVSANLAGGTHHSFADSGQGYCVFNDACVAAKVVQRETDSVQRVLIVDCDVHQGNGTASITRDDNSVFAFSMHCDKNYPFKKTNGDFDIALPEKTNDDEYLEQLENALADIARLFDPDFVFYLAGADPFEGDRLGLLSLTKKGLRSRDELVLEFCNSQGLPVALSMAGGYAPDCQDIVDIHFGTIEAALTAYNSSR